MVPRLAGFHGAAGESLKRRSQKPPPTGCAAVTGAQTRALEGDQGGACPKTYDFK